MSDTPSHSHSPAHWTPLLRCPACLGPLTPDMRCNACATAYPVVDGIPCLSIIDAAWHTNLREVVNYHYFYRKLTEGRVEADRLSQDEEHHRRAFDDQRRAFEAAIGEIDFAARPLVADIGAGMGETSQILAERGARVIATDLHTIDLARPRYLTIGRPPGNIVDVIRDAQPIPPDAIAFGRAQADAALLPFPSDTFDVVFSRSTWHHYFDLDSVLAECARILKPGGKIVASSEPMRAQGDNEMDHVADVFDYQEGINETAPTWAQYAAALGNAGFGDVRLRFIYAAWGADERARRAKWWNRWRTPQPRLRDDRPLTHYHAQLLARMTGGFNLTAIKMETSDRPRGKTGPPILPTETLARVAEHLTELKRTARETTPETGRFERIDFTRPVPRHAAIGIRPPETVPIRFAFCHYTTRILLAGKGNHVRLRLFAPPGQAKAGIRIRASVSDQPAGELPLNWSGEREWTLPVATPGEPVIEVMLEHDRLWQAPWPEGAPTRELGVGLIEAVRL